MDDPYRAPATLPATAPAFPPVPQFASRDAVAGEYYSPPTLKLASLSLVTLGLYPLYWFWQNWRAIKRETGGTQWPWARAVFAPLWSFLCFSDLRDIAVSRRRDLAFAPGLLAAVYFLLNLAGRLPGALTLLSLFTFVPILPINSLLRRYHREEGVDTRRMDRFGVWHILLLVFGGLFLLLVLFGFSLPDTER
ncbi:hypothetical protein KQ945_02540 [Bacillus subtilis subsp. subtilis]|nr:hypothetical protein [Bacillus subtilis subsp. subtilis]